MSPCESLRVREIHSHRPKILGVHRKSLLFDELSFEQTATDLPIAPTWHWIP
jgi:hypothetical protein